MFKDLLISVVFFLAADEADDDFAEDDEEDAAFSDVKVCDDEALEVDDEALEVDDEALEVDDEVELYDPNPTAAIITVNEITMLTSESPNTYSDNFNVVFFCIF
ncbi:MAG TPA: hypothetical protein VHO66_10280 [Ruminiclostridium sp.]|nr:hypothetical protein [Ruminiclostridium sp.]